jgi:hypothetical protein
MASQRPPKRVWYMVSTRSNEHQWLPIDIVGAAVIAEHHLMCSALRDTNGCAIQTLQILRAGILAYHKALAVVEIDRALP